MDREFHGQMTFGLELPDPPLNHVKVRAIRVGLLRMLPLYFTVLGPQSMS